MSFLTKDKRKQISIIVLFGICFLALLWRCFKGFDWSDESYYLATAYRFFQGDKLVVDDWNPSGLFTILLLPFFYIYPSITGNLDGIFLFCRICYVILSFGIGIYMYRVMKKIHGESVAICSTLIFLFYARFTILTFSYNTITQSFLQLCILILYQSLVTGKFSLKTYMLFGIFASITAIANPLFALLYIAMIVVLFFASYKTYKIAIWGSLATVFVCFCIFCIYLSNRVSLKELIEMLPILMNENEYAKDAGLVRQLLRIPMAIIRQYKYTMLPYVLTIAYVLWKRIYKRALSQKDVQITWLLQLIILISNIFFSGKGKNIGISFIAFTMFGLHLYIIQSKRNWKSIILWYIIGISSAVLFHLASNTGIYAVASGCMLSAIATIVVISEVFTEYKEILIEKKAMLKLGTLMAVGLLLLSTIYLRLFFVYRDAPIVKLNARIENGPGKGIDTTPENARKYHEIYEMITKNVKADDTLLISKLLPWGYMVTEAKCGANTTWRVPLEGDRIKKYYIEKPDRVPNVIFVANENYGVTNNNNEITQYWETLIKEGNYAKMEFQSGVLYKRDKN